MQEEIKQPEPQNNDKPASSADKFAELEAKCDEYLNNWKRAAADMANYKKEEMARAGMLIGYAKEGVFSNLLPIIDSIYMAAVAFGKEGFAPIEKQIQEFLKKEGIEEIKAVGQKFDPNSMEIMEEVEGGESGMVVEEMQKGYKVREKVLRPAKVKVSK